MKDGTLKFSRRRGCGGAKMAEFKGTSLAFGERTAQLLPWGGSLIAMVTMGQSSHDCPRVTVHMCVCGCCLVFLQYVYWKILTFRDLD